MALSSEEIKNIERLYHSIIEKSTFTTEEKKNVRKAFDFANVAHVEMRRKNGIPYIFHPLEVAEICLAEIGLDATSLCCAFLHDVVEDTEYTYDDIQNNFGKEVADIVDGLTKIPKSFFIKSEDDADVLLDRDIIQQDEITAQIANFQKLLESFRSDIRVILIKIADRLHNMRTLDSMKRMNQIKTSSETHLFYAPLAQSLGLYEIKTEMDNLSLKYRYPKVYEDLSRRIKRKEKSRRRYIKSFLQPIEKALNENNISYRIVSKSRSEASIWEKMESKNLTLEDVYENYTLKIIFMPSQEDNQMEVTNICHKVYVCATTEYKPKPNSFRDYITQPKSNGYKALHVVVMGQEGKWVEIQAMSEEMYQISIRGFLAEQRFNKENYTSRLQSYINKLDNYIDGMDENPSGGITDFRSTFFLREIIVFTFKGHAVRLPLNSTILDFAYSLRTDLGHHCIGAKVNHKNVSVDYKLSSGDKIEILTINDKQVDDSWLDKVITPKAKQEIGKYLQDVRNKTIENGLSIFKKVLETNKIKTNATEILQSIYYYTNHNNEEDILYSVGKGTIAQDFLIDNIQKTQKGLEHIEMQKNEMESFFKAKSITLNNIELYNFISLAKCCDPIPGDELIGIKNIKKRIVIHQVSCPTAIRTIAQDSERTLEVIWKPPVIATSSGFKANLNIQGIDRLGLIHDLTKVISFDANVNMKSLQFDTDNALFRGNISLSISSKNALDNLMDKLLKIKGIENVNRTYNAV